MKRLTLLSLFLVLVTICNGQEFNNREDKDYQKHKGFYLSLCGGVNFADISAKVENQYDMKFKGAGGVFDFKIGGALKENLILHATLVSKSMSGPEISLSGKSENSSNNLTIGEAMIGAGLTYYVMPTNIFLSASIGLGNFTLINSDNDTSVSTDRGFSMQLKVGKEWWVSKRWGLGVALTYSKSKLTNTPGGGIEEFMNSDNFGILFNATLN